MRLDKSKKELLEEINELKHKLEEKEETLKAISEGEVDAIIVKGNRQESIYTLKGGDYAYRIFIENMTEGAVTMDDRGLILYCNIRFSELVRTKIEDVIGSSIYDFVAPQEMRLFESIFLRAHSEGGKGEITFLADDRTSMSTAVSMKRLQFRDGHNICMVVTDITDRKEAEQVLKKAHQELERRVAERTAELTRINEKLRKEIAERKKAEEVIENALTEKDVLIREVHHRVKNNLQIISSLLNLQSGLIEDEKSFAVFQDSRNRIRSIALIHEKLYQHNDLAHIDIADYIADLSENIVQSFTQENDGIKLEVDVESIELNIDTAITVGLIINELVSNCLKHAFKENKNSGVKQGKVSEEEEDRKLRDSGRKQSSLNLQSILNGGGDGKGQHSNIPAKWTIKVGLKRFGEGKLRLSVGDNGCGMKEPDFEGSDTLGMQLVWTFTGQLNGNVEYNNHYGSEFVITFPFQLS